MPIRSYVLWPPAVSLTSPPPSLPPFSIFSYFLSLPRRCLLRTLTLTIPSAWKTLCPYASLNILLASFRSLPNVSSSGKPSLTTHININIRSQPPSHPTPFFPFLALAITCHYVTHWDIDLSITAMPTEM